MNPPGPEGLGEAAEPLAGGLRLGAVDDPAAIAGHLGLEHDAGHGVSMARIAERGLS
jgi:hypothetical protein